VGNRTLHSPESSILLNIGIDEASSIIGPQSWLFLDLTDHDYGEDQPKVTPAKLLRVNEVQVEILVMYGMRVNLMSIEPISATFSRGKTGLLP
jgi:hypothetical protein